MKSKADKLDVNKLVPVPVDLSKLSNVVKNDVVENIEYNELVKTVNEIKTIDTSDLVKIGEFDTKFREIEKLLVLKLLLED